MIISLIAAMAENRVIGWKNTMPWDIPSDREHFQKITMGHPIIVGRVTFEIIGGPLPGRKNIVLTRNKDYRAEGAVVVHNLESAFKEAAGADEVFICGGGIVFREAISLADRIYLTLVHRQQYEGDAFFPEIPDDFVVIKREEVEGKIPYSCILYERRKKG